MISRRTFLASTLGTAATGSLLTACGGTSDSTSAGGTLTVMAPLIDNEAPAPDNPVAKAVSTLTGKTLNVTWVPNSSYGDKTNVLLASGDLPQIMVIQGLTSTFVQAAEAGGFWELSGVLGDFPDLATSAPQVQRNASVNGKIYGLYRDRDIMRSCVILRKDWLTKLGLQPPRTTDDLRTIAKAFAEGDPDRNGAKDTRGIIIPAWKPGLWASSPYDVVETWFGAPNTWGLVNGAMVPSFETDAFLEANRFLRGMVADGLINKDFATLDGAQWNSAFFTGKGGIIIDTYSRAAAILKLFKKKDPQHYGDYLTITGNLLGPGGAKHSYPTAGFSGIIAFPKKHLPTEKDLRQALTVLDRFSTREGQILVNNGIEGRSFTVRDGRAFAVTPETADSKLVEQGWKAYAQIFSHGPKRLYYPAGAEPGPDKVFQDTREGLMADDLKTAVFNPAAPYISKTFAAKGAQLIQALSDDRIRYLAGQIDENALKQSIARWKSGGGDQIANELTELHQKNPG